MIVGVSPSLNIYDLLSYEYKGENLSSGTRVLIPIRNRIESGWIAENNSNYKGRVKRIFGVIDNSFNYSEDFICFIKELSKNIFIPFGLLMDYTLLSDEKNLKNLGFKYNDNEYKLKEVSLKELNDFSKNQSLKFYFSNNLNVSTRISKRNTYKNRIILSENFDKELIEIVNENIRSGKRILVITNDNTSSEYYGKYIEKSYVYNSTLSPSKRRKIVREIIGKDSFAIIGGVLAVFLPLDFDMIVIDDYNSYKYEINRFNSLDYRSVARFRAKYFGIELIEFGVTKDLILSSSTISDKRNKIDVDVFRIKPRDNDLSSEFLNIFENEMNNKNKVMILSSKGYSFHSLYCKKCKKFIICPKCESELEVKLDFSVKCKNCSFFNNNLETCPDCGEELILVKDFSADYFFNVLGKLSSFDKGFLLEVSKSKKVKEMKKMIKESDNFSFVVSTPRALNYFINTKFDTIIFYKPEGIVSSESINFGKSIFNIINFSKRFLKPEGKIYVFSVFHFHYSLKFINLEEDYLNREKKYRKWFHLPPYYRIFNIILRSKNLRKLASKSREILEKYGDSVIFKKVYLKSRKSFRGNYTIIIKAHVKKNNYHVLKSILFTHSFYISVISK